MLLQAIVSGKGPSLVLDRQKTHLYLSKSAIPKLYPHLWNIREYQLVSGNIGHIAAAVIKVYTD